MLKTIMRILLLIIALFLEIIILTGIFKNIGLIVFVPISLFTIDFILK